MPVKRHLSKGWIIAHVLFVSILASYIVVISLPLELLLTIISGFEGLFITLALIVVIVSGEVGLWILILGSKNKLFPIYTLRPAQKRRDRDRFITLFRFAYILYLVLFAGAALFVIPLTGIAAYEEIPQSYGGGKRLQVQLFVDRARVPGELLIAGGMESPARTIPLNLIFRTSNEYIVDPVGDDDRRAWLLNANSVYAMVETQLEEQP